MKNKSEPQENIIEVLDGLFETYEAFNVLLKNGTLTHKVQAVDMMTDMHLRLRERLDVYSESYATLDKDNKELLEEKAVEYKEVADKTLKIEKLMEITEDLMKKYYPVKSKAVKSAKKRTRIRRLAKKKIKD